MLGRALLVWLILVVVAVFNGALRQLLLTPCFGESAGHGIGTVILSAAIVGITWFALPWLQVTSPGSAWRIGALWLGLTIAFEFLAGHYLFHRSWSVLLADYDLAAGRIWSLVLIATLLAPVLALRLAGR